MSKKPERQSPEGRLRLKTSGKSACSSRPSEESSVLDDADDSLADFKSPKQPAKSAIKIVRPKRQNPSKKSSKAKAESRTRGKQQLIPSLFAKKEAEESTFVCPLCLKSFSASDIQLLHTKNCALKNNVSTTRLLAAVELQEKQSMERKAMGLPSKPMNPKRKAPARRLPPGTDDPDIQLALALSKSLEEVEKLEELDEAIALAAGTDDKVLEMTRSQRRSTLVSFGFSTSKPAAEMPRKKRKKVLGPTILQSRTLEVREQILTEKIAEVLVGSGSITQQMKDGKIPKETPKEQRVKRYGKLKRWWNESADLWRRSDCQGNERYYVEELREAMGIKEFCEDLGAEGNEDLLEKIGGSGERDLNSQGIGEDRLSEDFGDLKSFDEKYQEIIEEGKNEKSGFLKIGGDREGIKENECKNSDLQEIGEDREIEEGGNKNSDLQKIDEDHDSINRWSDDFDVEIIEDHKIVGDCVNKNEDLHTAIEDRWSDLDFENTIDAKITENTSNKNKAHGIEDHWSEDLDFKKKTKNHELTGHSHKNSDSQMIEDSEDLKTIECQRDREKNSSCVDWSSRKTTEDHKSVEGSERKNSDLQKSIEENERKNNQPEDRSAIKNQEIIKQDNLQAEDLEVKAIRCLSNDWSKMVASSFLSDIAIFLRDTSFIHAHSLVFWTRCHSLTDDYEIVNFDDRGDNKCFPIKNKIHWATVDREAAIVFLKYIYSGRISPEDISSQDVLDQVTYLGEKYKITELLESIDKFKTKGDNQLKINELSNPPENFLNLSISEEDSGGIRKLENILGDSQSTSSSDLHEKSTPEQSINEENYTSAGKIDDRSQKSGINSANTSPRTRYPRKSYGVIEINSSPEESPPVAEENSLQELEISLKNLKSKNNFVETRRLNTTSPDLFDDSELFEDLPEGSPRASPPGRSPQVVRKPEGTPEIFHLSSRAPDKKSEMSAFIDKIQRQQARGLLDSDTDGETPVKVPQVKRNPFKVHLDDSDPWGPKKPGELCGPKDKVTPLSFLENDVRARGVVSHEDGLQEQEEGLQEDDEDYVNTSGFLEESRYSKYLKTRRNNSIDKYRQALMNSWGNSSDAEESCDSPGIENLCNSPDKLINDKSEVDDSQITRDECSQFRKSLFEKSLEDPETKVEEKGGSSLRIPEDLEFDTWEGNSAFDPGVTERSHWSGCENAPEMKMNENSNLRDSPGSPERNSLPSPIVLSSDEEVADVMNSQVSTHSLSPQVLSQDSPQVSSQVLTSPKTPLRPTQHLNCLKRSRTPSVRISHTVTPPLDYSRMDSPELHSELDKYGLKPQRRVRAIQLLEHIYNELHPLVPVDSLPQETIDSENEEPLTKKIRQASEYSEGVIPEEMEFQESEVSQGVLSVQEAFQQLLKNDRKFHGKILAYEPLPLETLCERLKVEGFSGKINDVMDFLDDECITFQVQMQKRNKRKNEKNRKTTKA
ncbi:uncharacterized protein mus312 [Fopius arisanus]|uniref:Structure-specific endonuclease subunit SLX4 n=2 Tax=Fopius arisanus TaxID=64838 RepID=A0A9R1U8B6_9HYME|nr:PREDICTED: uncharacterized protein LOC105271166 [Fopius arisanus]